RTRCRTGALAFLCRRQGGTVHVTRSHGCPGLAMSTGMSVPKPRFSGPGAADSELLLAAMLGDAPVGLALIGPDLTILRVNATLARLTGLEEGRQAGRPVAEAWPAALAEQAQAAVPQVLAGGQPLAG